MASLVLEYEEEVLTQRDQYARIDVQRYRVRGDAEDPELLTALVACPPYGNFKYDVGDEGTHGPFLQKDLSAEAFQPCASSEATHELEIWLGTPREATAEERGVLRERILPFLAGTLYRLAPDGEGPLSIGATWVEIVAIDRKAGTLTLVVAWDD